MSQIGELEGTVSVEPLEGDDLSAQMIDLARRYPGQPVVILFDGEKVIGGILSLSELLGDDWFKGPVTILTEAEAVSLAL